MGVSSIFIVTILYESYFSLKQTATSELEGSKEQKMEVEKVEVLKPMAEIGIKQHRLPSSQKAQETPETQEYTFRSSSRRRSPRKDNINNNSNILPTASGGFASSNMPPCGSLFGAGDTLAISSVGNGFGGPSEDFTFGSSSAAFGSSSATFGKAFGKKPSGPLFGSQISSSTSLFGETRNLVPPARPTSDRRPVPKSLPRDGEVGGGGGNKDFTFGSSAIMSGRAFGKPQLSARPPPPPPPLPQSRNQFAMEERSHRFQPSQQQQQQQPQDSIDSSCILTGSVTQCFTESRRRGKGSSAVVVQSLMHQDKDKEKKKKKRSTVVVEKLVNEPKAKPKAGTKVRKNVPSEPTVDMDVDVDFGQHEYQACTDPVWGTVQSGAALAMESESLSFPEGFFVNEEHSIEDEDEIAENLELDDELGCDLFDGATSDSRSRHSDSSTEDSFTELEMAAVLQPLKTHPEPQWNIGIRYCGIFFVPSVFASGKASFKVFCTSARPKISCLLSQTRVGNDVVGKRTPIYSLQCRLLCNLEFSAAAFEYAEILCKTNETNGNQWTFSVRQNGKELLKQESSVVGSETIAMEEPNFYQSDMPSFIPECLSILSHGPQNLDGSFEITEKFKSLKRMMDKFLNYMAEITGGTFQGFTSEVAIKYVSMLVVLLGFCIDNIHHVKDTVFFKNPANLLTEISNLVNLTGDAKAQKAVIFLKSTEELCWHSCSAYGAGRSWNEFVLQALFIEPTTFLCD